MLKILPITGVPLPLVSYGGSSLVPTLVAMGILMSFAKSTVSFAADPTLLATAKLGIVTANLCAIALSVTAISLRTALIGRYRP